MRFLLLLLLPVLLSAQEKLPAELLRRDFDLLQQALERGHTGLYWYTPPAEWDTLFTNSRARIRDSMTVIEFYRIIGPVVSATREDHTDISYSRAALQHIRNDARYLPLYLSYARGKWHVRADRSALPGDRYGRVVTHINDVPIRQLAREMGTLFASDGYITRVKWSDLDGFSFPLYHYLRYGTPEAYRVTFDDGTTETFQPATLPTLRPRKRAGASPSPAPDTPYSFRQVNDTLGYLSVSTFGYVPLPLFGGRARYRRFLRRTFQEIDRLGLTALVVDVSWNGGGNEGNENLLYSYLGDNYRKYHAVRMKDRRITLDNGHEQMTLTSHGRGSFRRNYKQTGSGGTAYPLDEGYYVRRTDRGHGVMAFREKPKYPFTGNVYVIIGPVTYSGGSEFANMMRVGTKALILGEETGGAFNGNTSGGSFDLKLPHTGLRVSIPDTQFDMNIPASGFGRGLLPDVLLEPTFEDWGSYERLVLEYLGCRQGL